MMWSLELMLLGYFLDEHFLQLLRAHPKQNNYNNNFCKYKLISAILSYILIIMIFVWVRIY